ncbi:MAG: hypothetical protein IV108_13470 [Burkholderiales bacterium]|nr:hypothetical protein [Burkholderiales bacterium]
MNTTRYLDPIRHVAGQWQLMLVMALAPSVGLTAALNLSNVPLQSSAAVSPNVMLLIDNSGSMNNIVWASGYNNATTYASWGFAAANGNISLSTIGGGACTAGWKSATDGTTTKCLNLPDPVTAGATRYTGNYLNYLFATYADGTDLTLGAIPTDYRMDVARTVASTAVTANSGMRFGVSSFNFQEGGKIDAVCGSTTATLTTAIGGLSSLNWTPLAESLYEVTRYFRGLSSYYNSGVSYTSPIQYRCQKNFTIVITDGLPTYDNNFPTNDPDDVANTTTSLPNWDGLAPNTTFAMYPTFPQYSDGFQPANNQSFEGFSLYLDDIAKFALDTDMKTTGNDLAGISYQDPLYPVQNMRTYTIGFAVANQMLQDAAVYGSGQYFTATNATALSTALNNVIGNIDSASSSSASVAANSTSLNTGSSIYQVKFNAANWSGDILSFAINATNGTVSTTPAWEGGTVSWITGATTFTQATSARVLYTYKPSTADGILFAWPAIPSTPTSAELDVSQSTALDTNTANVNDGNGNKRLAYLRGDATEESCVGLGCTPLFRTRPANKLGDIVNSAPAFVGKPSAGYPSFIESVNYADFRDARATRTKMLYVGANDGMLHGFEATTGKEIMGYVPSKVYPNLSKFTTAGYAHNYFVDGSPTIADVFYGGAWHTVLVGSLAGGGQGVFALDITDPANFTNAQANAASVVLWEFNDYDNAATTGDPDGDANLGLTYSQPGVGRVCTTRAGGVCTASKWVAIFGNGYNNTSVDGNASSTGFAYLYVVDIETGKIIKTFNTQAGTATTPNGLTSPSLVDKDGDYYIDYVYAGDLLGNMWKFDLTTSSNSWQIAYGGGSPRPLYQAKSSDGTVQAITTRPQVTMHPTGTGYLVLFGTGKYLEVTTDVNTTTAKTQTYYGIWDDGAQVTSVTTRNSSTLLQQAVDAETSTWRHVTNRPIDWTASTGHKGWYIDLCLNGNTGATGDCASNVGEKQVSNSLLVNGRVIFTTLLPSTVACNAGGSSWLMEINFANGGQTLTSPFDTNADGLFNSADAAVAFGLGGGAGSGMANGTKLPGIAGTPNLVHNPTNKTTYKYSNLSSGGVAKTDNNLGIGIGRVSWRELLNE